MLITKKFLTCVRNFLGLWALLDFRLASALTALARCRGGPAKRFLWSRLSSLDYYDSLRSSQYLARRLFSSCSLPILTKKDLAFAKSFLVSGPYWTRTSDLYDVNVTL